MRLPFSPGTVAVVESQSCQSFSFDFFRHWTTPKPPLEHNETKSFESEAKSGWVYEGPINSQKAASCHSLKSRDCHFIAACWERQSCRAVLV